MSDFLKARQLVRRLEPWTVQLWAVVLGSLSVLSTETPSIKGGTGLRNTLKWGQVQQCNQPLTLGAPLGFAVGESEGLVDGESDGLLVGDTEGATFQRRDCNNEEAERQKMRQRDLHLD